MSFVAERFLPFGQSIFAEYTALANKHQAVNLSQGFPDFDGPELAKKAAIAAIQAGHAQYAPMAGVPPLRQAIAQAWQRQGNFAIDPDAEVTVTCGCSEAIMCCFTGLLNPGDEVIFFEPFFDFYAAGAAFAGATPRYVTLYAPRTADGSFSFDPAELAKAFTPRTKAILLNSPHNPTGKVYTRSELQLIADLCIKHNVTCISDEVYEHLTFEPALPHISIASLPGMRERTITLSSLGKSFSLTGWKVGWSIAPPPLTAAVRASHQFNTFSGATPLQHGAAAMLLDPGTYILTLRQLFTRNRDTLSNALRAAGLTVFRSDSTYFVMADHSAVSKRLGLLRDGRPDDRAFCEHLVREVGVASIPPSVFYHNKQHGHPLVRFAFCKKAETMDEAARRLASLSK